MTPSEEKEMEENIEWLKTAVPIQVRLARIEEALMKLADFIGEGQGYVQSKIYSREIHAILHPDEKE